MIKKDFYLPLNTWNQRHVDEEGDKQYEQASVSKISAVKIKKVMIVDDNDDVNL